MTNKTERHALAAAAEEAIDQLQVRIEHAKWLNSLAYAISKTLTTGPACLVARAQHAETLANLAQYLALDMTAELERDAAELQRAVDAAEAKE